MFLHLDFETRSSLDIKKVGLDNYARAAEAILLAWAIDDGPVEVEEGSKAINCRLAEMLTNCASRGISLFLTAWNSSFEQTIMRECFGIDTPNDMWLDPSVLARSVSLPGGLNAASEALGLDATESKQKSAGTRLINKFSKPTKTGEFRNHVTDPEDWKLFVEYCRQDVVAERAILHKLRAFNLSPLEYRVYLLDQKINQTGIPVSLEFVEAARSRVSTERAKLTAELKQLTGLANPNSVKQLTPWLRDRGYPFQSLGAPKVRRALSCHSDVMEVQ